MSNKWSGVKSIVDYNQDEKPTSPNEGEIWYKPSDQSSYLYNGTEFKTVRGNDLSSPPVSDGQYGYTAGGYWSSSFRNEIRRFQFPFDSGTGTTVGVISDVRRENCSCNSSNYGFSIGGRTLTVYISTIDRISFPWSSGTASHVGNLSVNIIRQAGFNSTEHGFAGGGIWTGGTTRSSIIFRFAFPFDSGTSSAVGNLAYSLGMPTGNNSSNHGYICSGDGPTPYPLRSYINRMEFPFDSGTADNVGNLSGSKKSCESANSSNHGYIMGGYDASLYNSIIDRITYPFDSGTASNTGNLANSASAGCGVNSTQHGYYAGGYGTTGNSAIERFAFPFDSGTAGVVGNLSGTQSLGAGITETVF